MAPTANTAKAHTLYLRLALPPYTIHFQSPSYLRAGTLELLDQKVSKHTLRASASDLSVRTALGRDAQYWGEMQALLRAAIPSLERRSFSIWDPSAVDYESTSGSLIAGHYPGLWKDLERLNDLLSIARNALTTGREAQDAAAARGVEHEVFRLINCCVRVTARGYDGDAGTGEEEKWQWGVNAFKKVLITALQWLNNFAAQNEERRIALWVALFDGGADGEAEADEQQHREKDSPPPPPAKLPPAVKPDPPTTNQDILLAYGTDGNSRVSPLEMAAAQPLYPAKGFAPYCPSLKEHLKAKRYEANGYVLFTALNRGRIVQLYQELHQRAPMLAEIHKAIPGLWEEEVQRWKREVFKAKCSDLEASRLCWKWWEGEWWTRDHEYQRRLKEWEVGATLPAPAGGKEGKLEDFKTTASAIDASTSAVPKPLDAARVAERMQWIREKSFPSAGGDDHASAAAPGTAVTWADEYARMPFDAASGSRILESGKAELMKRLESYEEEDAEDAQGDQQSLLRRRLAARRRRRRASMPILPPEESEEDDGEEDSDEDEDDDEDEDEDDEDDEEYPGSTEDGRGLLTDVPLILGPTEIEVLPMFVMSALLSPSSTPNTSSDPKTNETPTLLTHFLLHTPSGLNLLRELLIFVAAWDLREEELYFKFMLKIVEAILHEGLLPLAYNAFRDRSRSKDIISPAQAVLMKLLTCIFRANVRGGSGGEDDRGTGGVAMGGVIRKTDLHVLHFLFAEFRQHIIPQTCALIFLQGRIHEGRASPEDFPLNLWDMERMYEGVYQFLEFFAVLGEGPRGGGLGGNDSVGGKESDQQLDWGEKMQSVQNVTWKSLLSEWEMASELVTLLRELDGGIPSTGVNPAALQHHAKISLPRSVPPPPPPPAQPLRSLSADAALPSSSSTSIERPFDFPDLNAALHAAAAAGTPASAAATGSSEPIFEAETPLAYPEEMQDEPSDFEWRNLKKLTVLVLSSLLWKNKVVQEQTRRFGGLEALVACCREDENNPMIRDHAVMCLRFAVEGCESNAEYLRKMAGERRGMLEAASGSRGKGGEDDDGDGDDAVTGVGEGRDVPPEVLDTNGWETFMDKGGAVGLRRKPTPNSAAAPSTGKAEKSINDHPKFGLPYPLPSSASTPPSALDLATHTFSVTTSSGVTSRFTAEKAAELMQNALRDLPLGDKLVTDRQKAEALARLDRAFESSEVEIEAGRK